MNMTQILDAIAAATSLDELADIMSDVEANDDILAAADARKIDIELEMSVPTEAIEKHEARKASTASSSAPASAPAAAPTAAPVVPAPAAPAKKSFAMHETAGFWLFDHIKTNAKGDVVGLQSTIENVRKLFELYNITCRYNAMTKRIDIRVPGVDHKADNGSNSAIAEIKSLCRRIGMPVTELVEYLGAIADKCVYHPVREWLAGAEWDGQSRLQALCETLHVAPGMESYRDAMVRRWLVSAIAALYSEKDTDKFELVLVLAGEQGLGKTSWLKRLCPDVENAVKDGIALNPDEKDSVLQAIKHWLIELGELDGIFRKADIAKLKAFLSRTDDEVRLPYAHMDSRFKRRTVGFGSVNGENFLTDTTGNRRWLTLAVTSVDYMHDIDMLQLWAEVRALYEAGEQWHLTKAEEQMLNSVNRQHEAIQPLEELLTEAFVLPETAPNLSLVGVEPVPAKKATNTIRLTSTLVVRGLGLPVDKKNTNEMAELLRKHFGPEKKNGKLGKFWELTPTRPANWTAHAA